MDDQKIFIGDKLYIILFLASFFVPLTHDHNGHLFF